MKSFTLSQTPRLFFGAGEAGKLTGLIRKFGRSILLVTGAKSFEASSFATRFYAEAAANSLGVSRYTVSEEPTPEMIDVIVTSAADKRVDVVVAIGGGSVLDAGKAISAMIPLREAVKTYLEGVGSGIHPGTKVPFIAVPTTSGTGSEATKNAVLSEVGEHGFKRSLRHDNFIPNVAVIDPLLITSCPPSVTATSGIDAFTQLLESYVSTGASPITDALCVEGLTRVRDSLQLAYQQPDNIEARSGMALAAYLSGITLANAGLGLVHGYASSVGGRFPIAHGVICSSLMYACNTLTIDKLTKTNSNPEALAKFAHVGKIFARSESKSDQYYHDFLVNFLGELREALKIPALADVGVPEGLLEQIAEVTDNKLNPVRLDSEERTEILKMAMRN